MSSGARSRRAARAARARWTRSVQSVSREGRVRTMRRIGLESRYQSPRARTDSGRTKGIRSGIERGGGDGKHVRVPFPRRTWQRSTWLPTPHKSPACGAKFNPRQQYTPNPRLLAMVGPNPSFPTLSLTKRGDISIRPTSVSSCVHMCTAAAIHYLCLAPCFDSHITL